jgi:hypothetical protein
VRLDDGEIGYAGYKRNVGAGKVDGVGTMLMLVQRCHSLTRIPSTTSELFYPVRREHGGTVIERAMESPTCFLVLNWKGRVVVFGGIT